MSKEKEKHTPPLVCTLKDQVKDAIYISKTSPWK